MRVHRPITPRVAVCFLGVAGMSLRQRVLISRCRATHDPSDTSRGRPPLSQGLPNSMRSRNDLKSAAVCTVRLAMSIVVTTYFGGGHHRQCESFRIFGFRCAPGRTSGWFAWGLSWGNGVRGQEENRPYLVFRISCLAADVETSERRWVHGRESGRVRAVVRFYAFALLRVYWAASRRARRVLARVLASSDGIRSALILRVAASSALSRAAGSSRAADRQ